MPPEPRMTHRVLRVLDWTLRAVGALAIVLIASSLIVSVRFSSVSPPRDMISISDFRKWRPDLTESAQFSVRGLTYYGVKGPYARPLPSDRSEFYFDSTGAFLTWNRDIGDIADPRILHPGSTTRIPVPISDIPDKE